MKDWHLFQHELQSDALKTPAGASLATGKGDQQQVYHVVAANNSKVSNCIDKSCPIHVRTRIQLLVNKADLECLVTEAMMLKEFLPKVLTPEYLTSFSKLTQIDQGA